MKPAKRPAPVARPGAARVLPMRLVSRVPLLRQLAPKPPAPTKKPALLSPRRLAALLRRQKVEPPPPALRIPFVSPVLRGVRQPLVRAAAVVRAARDVRKPATRWERLRNAARMAIDDPIAATRWDRLMGLGVGLVAGGSRKARTKAGATQRKSKPKAVARKPKARAASEAMRAERGLRGGLRRLQALLNENAGPGRSRDRREIDPTKPAR